MSASLSLYESNLYVSKQNNSSNLYTPDFQHWCSRSEKNHWWIQCRLPSWSNTVAPVFYLQLLYLCHEHMTESVWVTVCRWLMLERLGMGEGGQEYVGTCHTLSLHFLSLISSLPLQCYIPVHSCLSQSLIYWDLVNQKRSSRTGQ